MRQLILVIAIIVCAAHEAHAKDCTISGSPYPFGSYDVFSTSDTNVAPLVLTYSCNGHFTAVKIAIMLGTASTSFAPRTLTQGSEPKLQYYFYTSAAQTTIWGDGTGGSAVLSQAPAPNQNYTLPIYGRIVTGQDVTVGTYSEPAALTVKILDPNNNVLDSTTIAVSVTVVQMCKIGTGSIAFGNYDPTQNTTDLTVDSINAVTVRCTRGSTASTISLGPGLQPSPATTFNRFMASGANRLAYQIYTSSSRTTVWGDGTNSTATRAVTSPMSYLSSQSFTAYGTVRMAQDVAAGAYLDTITATVNF